MRKYGAWLFVSACAASASHPNSAAAEATATAAQTTPLEIEEIIVTARKRDETLISAPVVEFAVGAKELSRLAVNSLDGVSRIVPQLIIAPEGSSVQGGIITMRGISGPEQNPFA